ncbi:MAG: glycosyltransferase family 39 protein [Muribaculaceae bacterium]|nr:glycosyltransferase family 39 protein [Muribaculaceae bacterium]
MIQLRPTSRNLLLLLLILYIPFLGMTLFNTKGEPREAVVAVSMIQQHDWILPVSNGVDIPYKPPMLAWCIAIISELSGGEVTEYTSRLPSALAMIIMTMGVFCTIRRRINAPVAFTTALIMMTSFELQRAATSCRVDMLNTMFIVMAMLVFFRTFNSPRKRIISIGFILMMSGATLTKGPVGIILPCAVAWIYMLISGEHWWRATWQTSLCAILALILPALWYYAAWQRGGDEFYRLMMEENFGRMTGTMSYGSHENPWYYNIITIIAGMLPFTLLPLMSLPFLRIHDLRNAPRRWWSALRGANPWNRYAIVIFAVVFIFYCIPASKRSVYLLPLYPALAYAVALLAQWLTVRSPRVLRIFAVIIALIPVIALIAFQVIRSAHPQVRSISAQQIIDGIIGQPVDMLSFVLLMVMVIMAVLTLRGLRRTSPQNLFQFTLLTLFTIFLSFEAFFQPAVLNGKSDKIIAQQLYSQGFGEERQLHGWVNDSLLRFYTVNFYLGNSVTNCEKTAEQLPREFLVGEKDYQEHCLPKYGHKYQMRILQRFNHRSCDLKQPVLLIEAVEIEQ